MTKCYDIVKTRLVVFIEGGLVQEIYTDNPDAEIEVAVADHDIEGADEEDLITVTLENGEDQEYCGSIRTLAHAPVYVDRLFKATAKHWDAWEKREAKRREAKQEENPGMMTREIFDGLMKEG